MSVFTIDGLKTALRIWFIVGEDIYPVAFPEPVCSIQCQIWSKRAPFNRIVLIVSHIPPCHLSEKLDVIGRVEHGKD